MSSDDDATQLMAAFRRGGATRSGANNLKPASTRGRSTPRRSPARTLPAKQGATVAVENMFTDSSSDEDEINAESPPSKIQRVLHVRTSPVRNRSEYTYYEPRDEVESIVLERTSRKGDIIYDVKLVSGETKEINFEELLELPGGPAALNNHEPEDATSTSADDMRLRGRTSKANNDGFVDITTIDISSSEDNDMNDDKLVSNMKRRKSRVGRPVKSDKNGSRSLRNRSDLSDPIELTSSDEDSEESGKQRRRRKKVQEPTRRSTRQPVPVRNFDDEESEDDEETSDSDDILRSNIFPGGKRKRRGFRASKPEKVRRIGARQSERSTRATNNMEEAGEHDIYRSDSAPKPSAPQVKAVREVFETRPRGDLFRSRHVEGCEVCYDGPNVAPLVYCQGCSLAYHKNCLGTRSSREHLVTKVGDEQFILQCKRCVNVYQKKDRFAPNLSKCQDCGKTGDSCKPFRHRKTTMQEMKDREDNDGDDPITDVPSELVNNPHNVLFRCTKCSRAWHYHHLPPLSPYAIDVNRDDQELADERFREYSNKWMCKECDNTGDKKVGGLVAWRPSDVEAYQPGTPCELVNEDDKQYLIKWENQSYFRAAWFSGAWTWGVSATAMRRAFFKKEDGPKMRTEDAIPEEYLRIDIVLDIKFTSYVEIRSEEIDKARIKEVDKALIKYKGLGYEDAVWEKVPTSEDGDRWLDFVTAYNDWVAGRYIKVPKQGPLRARLEKVRNTAFAKLEREAQPENLVGGELMKYQMEGLNWLYYQWYNQKNGILADEMGLGKTIQVIGFMATLVQEHNCFPFIIVVPNSTCANWRREIKQWAPSLRVVAYFGSSKAREMAYKYEMYPEGTKDLRCHIVVTSYETASDDSSRRFLRGVNWAGLITDEGQRLKNDKSQLYTALSAVKAPFRLLMTGTPLQNNARELFNLLQFLDENINAAELEEKYAEMTSENIKELHEQIRPYILRRTKAQVLTFLPPLGQIILPISMSHLQKQVYKSILSKSPELLKALFTSDKSLKQQERANLSNILMQLRKCLCHPFVYSREIEERTDVAAVSHRNLVEASAKLGLLETLLPKLKERGHRVLIFSQFLDMLNIIEDFLDGMEMSYQRLDGTMGSLEKQKRIDQFNAPDSPLFAFLLSTRAGGVGINLATADTVIILDPDFNPHQDLQAIARAHRIGQKNKVLCFQLLTRSSVEEKIVQMGRKKMALDHVVVEQLDADEDEEQDVESILKYGAAELFKDDTADHDIRYDDASVEKLLDRSQIENTRAAPGDDSAESQFSFARVWANDTGSLQDNLDIAEVETAPDPGVWDKILKERQAQAAAEALARAHALGRGKRARVNVDYMTEQEKAKAAADDSEEDAEPPSPVKVNKKKKQKRSDSGSDTDFQVDSDEDTEVEVEDPEGNVQQELADSTQQRGIGSLARQLPPRPTGEDQLRVPGQPTAVVSAPTPPKRSPAKPAKPKSSVKPFVRAHIPIRNPFDPTQPHTLRICPACHKSHPSGACELKVAGVEHCGLCGLAHYGYSRTCPHIKSETQVREMLQALKNSPEKKELIDLAVKYLRGVKGTLVQQKRRDREKAAGMNQNMAATNAALSYATGRKGIGSGPPPDAQLNQHAKQGKDVHQSCVPPPRQQEQMAFSHQLQGGRPVPTGHAQGEFDERDVEDALRGFLGQGQGARG
ncbi:PHD/FYVE-zinc-finger like domain-containing protein [Boeremia exigua]|uniref:PHD/FYVE-zinc-finger like domain-containing protein n=1 Tax=Boeremia exigua TaxID=749465 RepID=UPI001E8E9ACA|nr:PHD/FYVE-zinc-finger like domain-containing protein [Boeremia exigua]KAH6633608.1 PHD/FYVE-zinc-finger like domain-containing protein [Boeremia exigua]